MFVLLKAEMPDMENFIKQLKISNFKSIREAELECGRVNLFVGKSNVLEALSLLGAEYSKKEKFLSDFIRFDKLSHLFNDQNIKKDIVIDTAKDSVLLQHLFESDEYIFEYLRFPDDEELIDKYMEEQENDYDPSREFDDERTYPLITDIDKKISRDHITLSKEGKILKGDRKYIEYCVVKPYSFSGNKTISNRGKSYLTPPNGDNLFWVLQTNQKLKEEIPGLFKEYGWEFLIDLEENKFAVQRRESGIAYKIPYNLIADTLQRIIFHYAAIFSNEDSVILFEEPEAHSFPPYVRELALKISESTDNQYFITTHSPHLFTTLVEETPVEELAVFITYFENYETKFKKLNAEEISELLDYGIDIFFNQRWFLNEEISENPA